MSIKKKLEARLRKTMNKVQQEVQDFEARGGMRGAAERVRARNERRARDLNDFLEDRGVRLNLGRWVPPSAEEQTSLRIHYRTLGVEYGADLEAVKIAYRAKMRQYHPDRHANDPEMEREATGIAQQLSIAYAAIEAHHKLHGAS